MNTITVQEYIRRRDMFISAAIMPHIEHEPWFDNETHNLIQASLGAAARQWSELVGDVWGDAAKTTELTGAQVEAPA